MKRATKSKTFQKGDDFYEVIEWFTSEGKFETNDYTPEGTNWSGGEPGPHDPVSALKNKYLITITKFS
jgi:hypothetical protein